MRLPARAKQFFWRRFSREARVWRKMLRVVERYRGPDLHFRDYAKSTINPRFCFDVCSLGYEPIWEFGGESAAIASSASQAVMRLLGLSPNENGQVMMAEEVMEAFDSMLIWWLEERLRERGRES